MHPWITRNRQLIAFLMACGALMLFALGELVSGFGYVVASGILIFASGVVIGIEIKSREQDHG